MVAVPGIVVDVEYVRGSRVRGSSSVVDASKDHLVHQQSPFGSLLVTALDRVQHPFLLNWPGDRPRAVKVDSQRSNIILVLNSR